MVIVFVAGLTQFVLSISVPIVYNCIFLFLQLRRIDFFCTRQKLSFLLSSFKNNLVWMLLFLKLGYE